MSNTYKSIEFYVLNNVRKPIFEYLNTTIVESLTKYIGIPLDVDSGESYTTSVHIIDISNEGIFGMLGKKHTMKDDALQRIILNDSQGTINTENLIIEDFTYFYIRISDLKIAVISNKKAPSFQKSINAFFEKIEDNYKYENLKVLRMSSDIKSLKNKAKSLSKIKVLVYGDKINPNSSYIDLFKHSQNNLKSVSTTLKFNETPISDKDIDLLANKDLLSSKFDTISVTCDSGADNFELDLIKEVLTLKVYIEGLDEKLKSSQDLNKIKEALIFSFNKLF